MIADLKRNVLIIKAQLSGLDASDAVLKAKLKTINQQIRIEEAKVKG